MYLRVAYISLLLLVFCKYSSAQREPNLINITQQDGLPSNETYCVYKDSKGYIWSSGDQGVVRHKGTSMQVIKNLPDNVVFKIREDSKGRVWFFSKTGKLAYFYNEKVYPYRYNDSIIKYISRVNINDGYVSDNDEIILSAKPLGNNYNIKKDGKILKLNNDTVDFRSYVWNIEISEWNENRLFVQVLNPSENNFAVRYLKINRIDGYKSVSYNIPVFELSNMLQFGAIKLKDNDVLFFSSKYIIRLKSDGTFEVKEFPAVILSLFNDKNNNTIWIGLSKRGIIKTNEQLSILEQWPCNNNSITSFVSDVEGEMWFSTLENGVYYTKNTNRERKNINQITAIPTQRIFNAIDSFILFANAEGIYKLVDTTASSIFKENSTSVGDLFLTEQSNIYFSRISFLQRRKAQTYTGDTNYTKYTEFKTYTFHKITGQIFNNLICYNSSSELLKFNKQYYLENSTESGLLTPAYIKDEQDLYLLRRSLFLFNKAKITSLFIKDSNTVFLGTENKLVIYNITSFNISKYKSNKVIIRRPGLADSYYTDSMNYYAATGTFHDFKDTLGLFTKGITAMKQMPNGILAIGLRFGGIALMEDTTIIGNITEANGLLNNSVKYILPVGNMLWLATPEGISVIQFSSFHPLKYTIKNFGEDVGLNNMIIYQLITFKRNILAATSKGIYEIKNIEKLLQQKPPPIPLYITTLNYYKGDTSGISNITLPYEHSRITVNFDAICYNTPKELQYYYRLINSENDTTWRILTSTQLILENLSPDKYELQIKAEMPKQQRFSEIQKLTIIVAKPWWQWNAVRFGAILLFLFSVYAVYKWRVRAIEKRETEKTALKTQMAELQQTALRSQMNPHFIFNCLTSIQQLLLLGNREEANDYLVKFSRLIRKTLELSVYPYSNLAQEKEYLTEYLELEQLRTPDHFDFYFNIDKDIDIYTTEIPNMMLQPIIENCIRHGIKHLQERKGKITVDITKIGHCINCAIADNGVGRKKLSLINSITSHKSYGMEIVKKRLTGLPNYKPENFFVKIIDLVDEADKPIGTKVIVQLPFKIVSV